MTVSICACGHPWPSHATRKYGLEFARMLMAQGDTVCSYCHCTGYTDAVEVENRDPFRVRPKVERGNFGTGHPLVIALEKTDEDVAWLKLQCAGCNVGLEPDTAIVFESGFYCAVCFPKQAVAVG